MNSRTTLLRLAVIAAAALTITGCGDDDDSDSAANNNGNAGGSGGMDMNTGSGGMDMNAGSGGMDMNAGSGGMGGTAVDCPANCTSLGDSGACLCPDLLEWSAAQAHCETVGMNLGTVASEDDLAALAQVMTDNAFPTTGDAGAWIGLNDLETEGTFAWSSGETLGDYQPWGMGQPNNSDVAGSPDEGEDCAVIALTAPGVGVWKDWPCTFEEGLGAGVPFFCGS